MTKYLENLLSKIEPNYQKQIKDLVGFDILSFSFKLTKEKTMTTVFGQRRHSWVGYPLLTRSLYSEVFPFR